MYDCVARPQHENGKHFGRKQAKILFGDVMQACREYERFE